MRKKFRLDVDLDITREVRKILPRHSQTGSGPDSGSGSSSGSSPNPTSITSPSKKEKKKTQDPAGNQDSSYRLRRKGPPSPPPLITPSLNENRKVMRKRLHRPCVVSSLSSWKWSSRSFLLYFYAGKDLTKFHSAVAAFVVNMFELELLIPAAGRAG